MNRKRFIGVAMAFALGFMGSSEAAAAGTGQGPGVSLDNDPALVGWWKFDEASGKKAADSSPKKHEGELEGAMSFDTQSAPGKCGKAVKLEGKNEGIKIAGYKGVTGPKPRTVSLWLKTAKPGGLLVSWGLDDHGQMFNFGFIRNRVGVTPKGGYLYMKEYINDDAWHHVAAVVEEASPPNLHDNVKLYKDGELAVIDDIGLLDLWPLETGDQLEVAIGRRFTGLIDEVRIYERPLSEEEIKTLYQKEAKAAAAKP